MTPDAGNPDSSNPDSSNPDSSNPDSSNPDSSNPDTVNAAAEPAPLGARPLALLAVAVASAVAASMTWVRAEGSSIPTTADTARSEVDRAGATEALHASGISAGSGVILLALACGLGALALWCVSPRYRPARAGYLIIALSAIGIATVVWFTGDDQHALAAVGGSADVNTDSVQLTWWPWATLSCFACACVIGVFTVPGNRTATTDGHRT